MAEARWVLVAEDDDDIRRMIRDSLESESEGMALQVVEAKDGLEALARANDREFHCVVTDLRMPRSTGADFLRAIQSTALNANTPKVIVTGAQTEEFGDISSLARIVPKPFEPEELAKTVIREIKLGRMDDRVAIHLVNPFLEAIQSFLSTSLPEDARLTAEIHQPSVSKSGEGLVGDIHCNLLLTSGVTRNRFTLSFDLTLLDYLKIHFFQARTSNWASLTPDSVARQTCQLLFDEASKSIQAHASLPLRLAGTSIFTYKNDSEYGDLVRTNGISIVAKTPHGRIVAHAFAKPKPKRA